VSEVPAGRSAVLLAALTAVCAVAAVAAFERSADR
jgi:hypothetical protein